jgi:hypothetical protein
MRVGVFATVFIGAIIVSGATPGSASVVDVGNPGDVVNSIPFGSTVWGTEYQQVYNSSDFSGAITITQIIFLDTTDPGGQTDGGTFTLSLSTTSAQVGALNLSNLSANIGTANTVVYSGSLPALANGELVINLTTPYTYNPAQGNLLLDVTASNQTAGGAFLNAVDTADSGPGDLFSRAWTYAADYPVADSDEGLVTDFTVSTTPLPPSWIAMLTVLTMAGFVGARGSNRRCSSTA